MKRRNNAFTAALTALALAFVPLVEEAGAQLDKSLIRISFAPVGLTPNQTARLNLINTNVANGIAVSCRFMDAKGVILAQSYAMLEIGKIVSVDFKRQSDLLPGAVPEQLRAEVQVQLDIYTYGAESE